MGDILGTKAAHDVAGNKPKHPIPASIDNTYRGHRLGLWLLGVVVFVKLAQVISVMVDAPGIIVGADGVPLDTFGIAGGQAVTAAFMGMAISRLLICTVCGMVLWRYRSAIPLIFGLLLIHDVARELVLNPIRVGVPIGPYVNAVLVVMTVGGLLLAKHSRNDHRSAARLAGR